MAKVPCKGTVLQREIAETYTSIAQLIDIDGPGPDVETYDATTLDTTGAGKEKKPTGYVDGGTLNFNFFLDPALAGHQDLTDQITTPAVSSWRLIHADTGTTQWDFDGVFKGLSPTVNMADGLKAAAGIELDGLVAYPT